MWPDGTSSHGDGLSAAACDKVPPVAVTRSIEIRTEIPGPRSREILERKERVVAEPLSIYVPVVIEQGRGVLVTDVDGNTSSISRVAWAA